MPLGTDPGTGISGYGSTISGASFGPLGMIRKISPGGPKTDQNIDLSTMNNGPYIKYIGGLIQPGECSIDMIYEKSQKTTFLDLTKGINKLQVWTFAYPDGSTDTTSGYISGYTEEIPHDNKITCTVTFQFSGAPTWHAGT